MRKLSFWMVGGALAAALGACQPVQESGPPSEAERAQIEQRVQAYFKRSANLPVNVTVKVIDLKPAQVSGLLEGNLEASNGTNTQKVPLVLSRDGRYLIQGTLTDLTADPFRANMEKMKLEGQPMRGNPTAGVTIVEFSDFQCPYCSKAYKTVEDEVLKNYGDKVRFFFKNYPLTNIHPWAESGALASECARKQSPEAFWKVYDFLFQNQQDISLDNLKEKAKGAAAGAAGVDVAAFEACFDSKGALDVVKAQQAEAEALGVRSTPTFFINGRKLEGAVPYETIKAALDEALNPNTADAPPAPKAG